MRENKMKDDYKMQEKRFRDGRKEKIQMHGGVEGCLCISHLFSVYILICFVFHGCLKRSFLNSTIFRVYFFFRTNQIYFQLLYPFIQTVFFFTSV